MPCVITEATADSPPTDRGILGPDRSTAPAAAATEPFLVTITTRRINHKPPFFCRLPVSARTHFFFFLGPTFLIDSVVDTTYSIHISSPKRTDWLTRSTVHSLLLAFPPFRSRAPPPPLATLAFPACPAAPSLDANDSITPAISPPPAYPCLVALLRMSKDDSGVT